MKRVSHHYAGKSYPYTEMPSAVRFRAFCASDVNAPSPFDPTQGVWHRVDDGLRDLIPEIAECLGDVQSDIRAYHDAGLAGDLPTLRIISTGLFFVSEQMLNKLKSYAACKEFVEKVSFDLRTIRDKYVDITSRHEHDSDRIATMPLLVRALIQDDWRRFDKGERRAVHEAIGDVLYEMAMTSTGGQSERELSYTPPRGHEKIPLTLEAIRHFMRAAETSDKADAERLTRRAIAAYESLEPGVFAVDDSKDVDHGLGKSTRLSRVYGLVSLKFEVLCLLSEDGHGIRPPRGLGPRDKASFFCELGIALTRMLRPHEAIEAFEKVLRIDVLRPEERSYVMAHAITAHLTLGDVTRAKGILVESRALEDGVARAGGKVEAIKSRNDARDAAIELAAGNAGCSAKLWANIADKGLISVWSDRAVGYIDAHLASDAVRDEHLRHVWTVAERAASKAHYEGLENERLRINIRRAVIIRHLGYAEIAESILDEVGLDLGRHGGSEMVFREFQFESAATLVALGRPRYAFAAYAWPAFKSIMHSDATPWVLRARKQCEGLLIAASSIAREALPGLDHPFWIQSDENDQSLAHPFFSLDLLPPIDAVQKVFNDLVSEEGRLIYKNILCLLESNPDLA